MFAVSSIVFLCELMLQKKSSTLLPPEVVGESATASEQTLAPRGAALSAMDRQCRQSKSAAENLNVRWHGKKGRGAPPGKGFLHNVPLKCF